MCARDVGLTLFLTGARRGTPLQNNRADCVLFFPHLILLLMLSFNGRGAPPCAPAMSASRCFFTGARRGTPLQNNRADYVLFFLLLFPSFNGRGFGKVEF